jgi:chromosomal replication initiation ATPase DnaA
VTPDRRNRLRDSARPRATELIDAVRNTDERAVADILDMLNADALHALAYVLAERASQPSVWAVEVGDISGGDMARHVIANAAATYGIGTDLLVSENRTAAVVDARAVACYALHRLIGLPSTTVAQLVNRNHTTVLYACGRVGENERLRRIATAVAESAGWSREHGGRVA